MSKYRGLKINPVESRKIALSIILIGRPYIFIFKCIYSQFLGSSKIIFPFQDISPSFACNFFIFVNSYFTHRTDYDVE